MLAAAARSARPTAGRSLVLRSATGSSGSFSARTLPNARSLSSAPGAQRGSRGRQAGLGAATGAVMLLAIYHYSSPVYADVAQSVATEGDLSSGDMTQQQQMRARAERQGVYAWGSNRYNVVAPDSPNTTLVKTPRSIPYFDGMSLRDLVLEEKHGVAVDANGDVLQWGLGFFDPSSREIQQGALDDVPLARRREKARANELQPRGELAGRTLHPVKTLTGKNIVRVVANDQKIYALAKNGDVYIFSSLQTLQSPGKPAGWSLNPLKLFNLFAGPTIDHERMQTLAPLKSGETFTSLEGGSSHILALTSKGRTFAAPIDDAGNAFGQLGLSRVQLNSSPDSDGKPRRIETLLEPRMLELDGPRDPHPQRRLPAWAMPPGMESFGEPAVPVKRDAAGRKQRPKDLVEDVLRPRYCTTLHEVPALRGVEIAQIAAGSEHSVARTPSGLVLGWGRQTHGQTGLSNALGMECVPIPSEIVLSKCFPNTSVDIRCTDVKAAADNTFFTMSRREPGTVAGGKIDVLAVGKGQWGTLGNAMWSQVTSVPVKVKTVSGLIEYSELSGKTHPVPIHHIAIGKPGHVALVLDTVETDGHVAFGRDVMVWGHNAAYQLGTGKRSNLCVPQHLQPLPGLTAFPGADAPVMPEPISARGAKLLEADVNSGVLTHMPHKRLQLASASKGSTHLAPSDDGKRGSFKRGVTVEEHITAGAVSMAVFWKVQP